MNGQWGTFFRLSFGGIQDHSLLYNRTPATKPFSQLSVATANNPSFSVLSLWAFAYNRAVPCASPPCIFHTDLVIYKQQPSHAKDGQRLLLVNTHIAQPHVVGVRERHIAYIVSLSVSRQIDQRIWLPVRKCCPSWIRLHLSHIRQTLVAHISVCRHC